MKRFYIFALVATMFAACATDATDEQSVKVEEQTPDTLVGTFEGDDSRIQLNASQKTVWTKGDLLSVFYRSNANQKWQYQGETGERTGELKRVSAPEYTATTLKLVVAYPYSENYYLNPETYNLQAYLPAEQTYLSDGSYALNGNIMVSQSEYKQFVLKSVCGWLKIQLKGEGQVVQAITLKGNNGEQVAGELYVNTTDATSVLAADMGSSSDDTEIGGTLVEDNTMLTSVTLNCGEGVTLGSTAKSFYIALPPQTFEKGFTIVASYADGTTMTKSTSNATTIERNHIKPMDILYYDGNLPPVYELSYATNDGQPLDPYATEGFGANFVENIYDAETGVGALKFDGQVKIIPERAFVACGNLTEINLPIGITAINAEAFSGCSKLTIMNIPQGVAAIGNKAFYSCGAITEITVPSSVTSIGKSSFEGCGGKAYINCTIPSISSALGGDGKFANTQFTEVFINDGVSTIGSYAFCNSRLLTSVTIGNSTTSIGKFAFSDCAALINVIIGDGVTSIGDYAFYECASLTNVIIGDGVTSICNRAFECCTSLTSVTIPDSVTSIGDYAFYECSSLTRATIGNGVTEIGSSAFSYCELLKEVHYNGNLSDWCKIKFTSTSNPMINGAILYLNGEELIDATIPSDITTITECTFHGCTSLKSVTLSKRVTSIEFKAFCNCTSLERVYCNIATPPTGGYLMFENNAPNCKIYVPRNSVSAYKSASGWSDYADYIEGYNF